MFNLSYLEKKSAAFIQVSLLKINESGDLKNEAFRRILDQSKSLCESKELSLGITGKKERNCHLALMERRKKAKFNLVGDTY